MTDKIRRLIAAYDKTSEFLVCEIVISNEEFEAVKEILGRSSNDPMYGGYEIPIEILDNVKKLFGNRLLDGDFNYFLEDSAF